MNSCILLPGWTPAASVADALEMIPYTLAENMGLKPIKIVMELRKKHADGNVGAGIDINDGCISNMYAKNVIQPLLVTTSVIKLATDTVCMILKVKPDFVLLLLLPQMTNDRIAILWWCSSVCCLC